VDRVSALELLPEVYAHALRLKDDGIDSGEIARQLGTAPEAVASTLELAEAKLRRLMQRDADGHEPLDGGAVPSSQTDKVP
jgi:DNA-directed RNA polymerase specialized sigma24 family protein